MVRVYAVPQLNYNDFYSSGLGGWNLGSGGIPGANLCRSSQFPHVDLDISQAVTVELELQWPEASTYKTLDTYSDWHVYYGTIFTPEMANGTTPDAIPLQFSAYYKNVSVMSLRPQGSYGEAEPGVLERGFSYAKAIADLVPLPIATPFSILFGAGRDVAKFFGWSRPPASQSTSEVARRVGSMALASGQADFNYHLGMDPAVQHDVSDVLIPHSSPGETKLSWLLTKPSSVARLSAGVGYAAHPGASCYRSDSLLELTPMAFAAVAFSWWKGKINFKFKFFASPLIRSRVAIMVVPPGFALPVSYVANGSYLTTIVEVVGSTEAEIVVPYLYPDPMQAMSLRDGLAATLSFSRVVWFVIAGPLSSNPSPPAPKCLLEIYGGDDFEVGGPSLKNINQYKVVNQGGYELVGTGPQSLFAFGEKIDDIHLLMRRYCEVLVVSYTTATTLVNRGLAWPVSGGSPTDTSTIAGPGTVLIYSNNWSYATWFRQAYLGWTGGNSWVVQMGTGGLSPNLARQSFVVPGLVTSSVARRINDGGTGCQLFPYGEPVEVSVPGRSPWNFNQTSGYVPATGAAQTECLLIHPLSPGAPGVEQHMYHAGSDDYHVGGFMAAPVLYARV